MTARKIRWGETLLGLLILGALGGLGAGLYFEQFRFHPAARVAGLPDFPNSATPAPPAASQPALLHPSKGLAALGPSEFFDAETLYEKINGKAELYLPAGFRSLECRRFGRAEESGIGVEAFLYDMGSPRAAYSVFGLQQRAEAERQDFARFAYLAENALFFCHGRYYAELVAGSDEPAVRDLLLELARGLIAGIPAEPADLPEIELLPLENRLDEHPRLYLADGFGFPKLVPLFVADYQIGDFPVSGFVSVQADASSAEALARAYLQFLLDDGAVIDEPLPELPNARVTSFFGTWQVIFTRGRRVGGVHQAGDRASAEQLALRLDRKLNGALP